MENNIYPLKFIPSFHYRIWGGEGLKKYVGKSIHETHIGESWEISTVPNFVSMVENGFYQGKNLNEVIASFSKNPSQFLGHKVLEQFGQEFPLLIKYIDAEAPLSVQVHPDDDFARDHENSFGKTEMWYIMRAEQDAELIIGFKPNTDKALYQEKLKNGQLESILQKVKPKSGDVYFIPAGRVHAIGKGITLAEIQQNSDVTYRIYDYNRKDTDGKLRELHTEKALQVADFKEVEKPATPYHKEENAVNEVVQCPYFTTSYLPLDKEWKNTFNGDSFTIYMGLKGKADFIYESEQYSLNLGDTLLIPAALNEHHIVPKEDSELLMVRI